uniref:BTB domain-containing protein n=1 Tax=Panagrolaimus sp. PS1159 TaxID=55785 RepID=A0AC35GR07_9BILA
MDSIETKVANECQIKMKWRIKEEVLKDVLKNDDTELIESKHFKAPKILGVEYYLLLKIDEENPNEINLFLHLGFEMARKINAAFKLSVKSASYEKNVEDVYEKSFGWGYTLCTRDEIFDAEKKFFVNGIMEIETEGTLKTQGFKRNAPESLSLLQILWENDEDKDITIIAEKEELKIHKWILCAKSPVFKAELNSGMKEARENRIEIPDFKFETVKMAIEHCYERDIKDFITLENASELLHFSDKYNIELLHHVLQFALIDKISESNVVKFANASVTSNAKELREFCVCFLMNAIEKAAVIEDTKILHLEITSEIGQRFLFPIAD